MHCRKLSEDFSFTKEKNSPGDVRQNIVLLVEAIFSENERRKWRLCKQKCFLQRKNKRTIFKIKRRSIADSCSGFWILRCCCCGCLLWVGTWGQNKLSSVRVLNCAANPQGLQLQFLLDIRIHGSFYFQRYSCTRTHSHYCIHISIHCWVLSPWGPRFGVYCD